MRLYLSSFGLGDRPEELVALLRGRRRAAIVLNAKDANSEASRAIRVAKGHAAERAGRDPSRTPDAGRPRLRRLQRGSLRPRAVDAGIGDGGRLWEGLGLLPYAVAPHYRSDHPESEAVERLVQRFLDEHTLFKALRDGEAIVVDGERHEVVGGSGLPVRG